MTEAGQPIVPTQVPGRRYHRGIVMYPDFVLTHPCSPLLDLGEKEQAAAIEMMAQRLAQAQVIHNARGVAAPQLGIPARMFLFMDGMTGHVVVNPEITLREGEQISSEGCLSLGTERVQVPRATHVRLLGRNTENKPFEFETEDPVTAAAIQHEMDHLEGRLIVDYGSRQVRKRVLRRIGAAA